MERLVGLDDRNWWESKIKALGLDRERLLFVYLMTNDFANTKTHSCVGVDVRPKARVTEYNEGKVKSSRARSTKAALGHWRLTMVIGPFFDPDTGSRVCEEWREGCRGIPSRINRGLELARKHVVTCWRREPTDIDTAQDTGDKPAAAAVGKKRSPATPASQKKKTRPVPSKKQTERLSDAEDSSQGSDLSDLGDDDDDDDEEEDEDDYDNFSDELEVAPKQQKQKKGAKRARRPNINGVSS